MACQMPDLMPGIEQASSWVLTGQITFCWSWTGAPKRHIFKPFLSLHMKAHMTQYQMRCSIPAIKHVFVCLFFTEYMPDRWIVKIKKKKTCLYIYHTALSIESLFIFVDFHFITKETSAPLIKFKELQIWTMWKLIWLPALDEMEIFLPIAFAKHSFY